MYFARTFMFIEEVSDNVELTFSARLIIGIGICVLSRMKGEDMMMSFVNTW